MSDENKTTDENTSDLENKNELEGRVREEEEVFGALKKLGPLFQAAGRSLKPARVIQDTQRADRATFFRNFKGQRLEKFTRRKIGEIFEKEVFGRNNVFMAHLLMVLWNETNRDLYLGMRKRVETINEDVESIEVIEDSDGEKFVAELKEEGFSLEDIYICVRMNEVRFTEDFIAKTFNFDG